MTGDIELRKMNVVALQKTGNGAVIDINDDEKNEFEEIDENGKIEEAQENTEEVTDSQTQDDENDEDDDENSPLGLCRFIVKHHRLAFGMLLSFKMLYIRHRRLSSQPGENWTKQKYTQHVRLQQS